MKEIIFYKKPNWIIPIEDFLEEIRLKNWELHAKILQKIDLLWLEKLGHDEVKYIWDKIYELRVKQSSNISRVFYFTFKNNNIILLDGIIKKTQKLNNAIITKIKKYKDDFLTQ